MTKRNIRICEVDGCSLKHQAKGKCGTHYKQFRRKDPKSRHLVLAVAHKSRIKNKKRASQQQKEWRERRKDYLAAKKKEYSDNNKNKISEKHKEYYKLNQNQIKKRSRPKTRGNPLLLNVRIPTTPSRTPPMTGLRYSGKGIASHKSSER